jgi:hypothetical protein
VNDLHKEFRLANDPDTAIGILIKLFASKDPVILESLLANKSTHSYIIKIIKESQT